MFRSIALTCLVFLCLTDSNAKILRVGMEYASITTANTAAVVGDTLQIYGSQNGTVTKRVVVTGFGYNFDVHPGLQAIGSDAPSQLTLYIQAGADSTIVEGIDGTVYTYSNKVIIRRCRTVVYLMNSSTPINDVKILNSVYTGGGMYYGSYPCSNLLMYNCIIAGNIYMNQYASGYGSSGAIINCVSPSTNLYNVLLGLGQANFLVKNSILNYSGYSSNVNTVYESNFFGESQPAQLPQGSNNRWAQTWATLFNRLGGSSDNPSYVNTTFDENYYILKIGSPAVNGGTNGAGNPTDCGIFGGEPIYVYRPSGVPAVPAIYKLTAPTTSATTNPYNVTLSVRSNN